MCYILRTLVLKRRLLDGAWSESVPGHGCAFQGEMVSKEALL